MPQKQPAAQPEEEPSRNRDAPQFQAQVDISHNMTAYMHAAKKPMKIELNSRKLPVIRTENRR
ncbi:hypothetical protein F441_05753 [Phytophthora nicotianae CJ01A1]|uniref:Uncharacterized protein n=5 Tax=Phytophthora nicotianae TaxID=4792 RepID=W2ZN68_PHYNI|nr:hypothetical protein F443_05745 [Phytophthora nicotianae P1569]ETK90667.1 hypothetical protein L915_05612 [Phytophthora nicotianae]ETO79512.1 hypothetical protein F444_05795 [Phytophthora nicotianae P1976]ETP20550.1 hypothetical protein F441_05753 [Phytophthora nicotianae CJ01A1]ETP48475.1 hypothetical protein F442_05794 [Phytophthora nicotianae P10297]